MSVKDKINALVSELGNVGIVPVIKLDKVENAEKLAKALRDGGINCAEVTFRAKGADEVISRMTKAYPDMLVGAGTVLSCEQVDAAIKAGSEILCCAWAQPEGRQTLPRQGRAVRAGAFVGKRNRASARTRTGLCEVLSRGASGRASLY